MNPLRTVITVLHKLGTLTGVSVFDKKPMFGLSLARFLPRRRRLEQSAVIYLSNDRLLVAPAVKTTEGVVLSVEPITLLAPDADTPALGQSLREALSASGHRVPHPRQDQWKGQFTPFLKAARVRSHVAFMRDARHVEARAQNRCVTLTPYRNLGPKKGFEADPQLAQTFALDDLEGIALGLRSLLGLDPQQQEQS